MKLPKFIKKPVAQIKRAVGRSPAQTKTRSHRVSTRYMKTNQMDLLGKISKIENKSFNIDDRIDGSRKFREAAKVRARARLRRIKRKKLDNMYVNTAPLHRQNRLAKHQELRQKKNKREDKILGEITAFSNAQKPVDFGSKKQYDKWQALRKAKKGAK